MGISAVSTASTSSAWRCSPPLDERFRAPQTVNQSWAKRRAMKSSRESAKIPEIKPSEFPAALFRSFERELGRFNIQLCVADAALQDFAIRVSTSPNILKDRVRRSGHHNLNTAELRVDLALDFSYISHISLLLSRMEQLCQSLRRHPYVNRDLNSSAQGDFLRRTLWVILQSRSDTKIETPLDTGVLDEHLLPSNVTRFYAYRKLRNDLFHAGESATAAPSTSLHPRFADVLQCSKSLQSLARALCRALIDKPRLIRILERRFRALAPARRRNAAISALTQEYLLDATEAQAVLLEIAW